MHCAAEIDGVHTNNYYSVLVALSMVRVDIDKFVTTLM